MNNEYMLALDYANKNFPDYLDKGLGMYTKENPELKHKSAIFLFHKENFKTVNQYVAKYIRPTSNIIGE